MLQGAQPSRGHMRLRIFAAPKKIRIALKIVCTQWVGRFLRDPIVTAEEIKTDKITQALKAKAGRESLARLLSIQAMAKLKNVVGTRSRFPLAS